MEQTGLKLYVDLVPLTKISGLIYWPILTLYKYFKILSNLW